MDDDFDGWSGDSRCPICRSKERNCGHRVLYLEATNNDITSDVLDLNVMQHGIGRSVARLVRQLCQLPEPEADAIIRDIPLGIRELVADALGYGEDVDEVDLWHGVFSFSRYLEETLLDLSDVEWTDSEFDGGFPGGSSSVKEFWSPDPRKTASELSRQTDKKIAALEDAGRRAEALMRKGR